MSSEYHGRPIILNYVKNIFLNTEAQEAWIEEADDLFLIALDVYSKKYIEPDEETSKTDAFRIGAIFGALYEKLRAQEKKL